jgi:uroporphyrinogen-III decarboxylase
MSEAYEFVKLTAEESAELESLAKQLTTMWLSEKMTPMQRNMAVMMGKGPIDRPPVMPTFQYRAAKEVGISVGEWYANPKMHLKSAMVSCLKYKSDQLQTINPIGMGAEALGAEFEYPKDGFPYLKKHPFNSLEEAESFEIRDPLEIEPLRSMLWNQRWITDHFMMQAGPAGGSLMGAMYTYMTLLRGAPKGGIGAGMNYAVLDYRKNPDRLKAVLDRIANYVIDFAALQIKVGGAMNFVMLDSLMGSWFMSDEMYEVVGWPFEKKICDAIQNMGVGFTLGGGEDFTARLPRFLDVGSIGLWLSSETDLATAKRLTTERKRLLTYAGLSKNLMWSGTPEEIKAKTLADLKIGMPGGRFMELTNTLDFDTPDENIMAYCNAMRSYKEEG